MSFDWEFFWRHLLNPSEGYLAAFGRTIYMAVTAQALGIGIGALVAAGRVSKLRIPRVLAFLYAWLIRGVPVIVFMVLFYTGLAAADIFRFEDIEISGFVLSANIQAAIIALGVREGAYMSEVIRNGVQAVEDTQIEAAKALGMSRWTTLRRVTIPQAMRVIIPPLGNNFNIMLKTTSLASVIGVRELFLTTRTISSVTFRVFEMFIILALNYLVLTTVWAVFQAYIEAQLTAHEAVETEKSSWERLIEFLGGSAEEASSRGIA